MAIGSEAPWRRRFRAARVTLPSWARDVPQRLLYASNASGKWELYAWDQTTDQHRQVTDRPEGTLNGRIDPTGSWILWFDDDKGNEFGRWMVEPFAGGDARPAAYELPPAYSAGVALAHRFLVFGSATDAGSAVHLVPAQEPARLIYSHREPASVAGLSRDETLLCISHSEHGDSRHPALRVVDLDGNVLADLWDGAGRGLWASGWARIPGDQRLLVTHERGDLHRPVIWNPATREQQQLALDLPGEVSASWYPHGDALLIAHDHRGRSELYRLDLATSALDRLTFEEGSITGAATRPDGAIWYGWTSAATPPAVWSTGEVERTRTEEGWTATKQRGRALLRPAGEPPPGGVPYRDYDAGGVHIFVAEPEGPRPYPTVFQIHGGPTAHDRDLWSPLVQAWVDHGFAVVLVNYRGSTGYGRAWRDALEGNPGLTELEDIAKAYDRVTAEGIAHPSRTVLAGGSWGGYLTLLGLGTQPERWSLGIAAVPVADYVAAYEDEMEPLRAFDRSLFGGSPADAPEVYRERSPITYIDRVRVPVLILAGENDPRCPIRQIDNYLTRLDELEKPHEVYRYDAGHGSLVIEEALRQVEAQIAFVARHLGTRGPMP